MNISQYITLEGVTLRIDGDYYGPSKGAREKGSGVQLEPDEPASFELTAVYVDGSDIDIADILSAGRLEECTNTVLEEIASGAPGGHE